MATATLSPNTVRNRGGVPRKPKQRDWNTLVRLGREAQSQQSSATWLLGDLALEVEPNATPFAYAGVQKRLAEYADELGLAFATLRHYRAVASAWPPDRRIASASWHVHRILMGVPDRYELLARLCRDAPGRRVTMQMALATQGKKRVTVNRAVIVGEHHRRAPGTVTPVEDSIMVTKKILASKQRRRRALELLTTKQLGELIEDAWAVLESA